MLKGRTHPEMLRKESVYMIGFRDYDGIKGRYVIKGRFTKLTVSNEFILYAWFRLPQDTNHSGSPIPWNSIEDIAEVIT